MPVHTLTHRTRDPASFIYCDKRDDINRVQVPAERLKQWQTSGTLVADLLAGLLGLLRPDAGDTSAGRWEVGMFRGKKESSHLVLIADGGLSLALAGHSIALAEVLTLEGMGFKLDKQTLVRLVDKPIAGAGDKESATQRRARLKKTFLKTVAGDEGISVSRLKQLLQEKPEPTKTRHSRSAY